MRFRGAWSGNGVREELMDFDKHQERVGKLEKDLGGVKKADPDSLKAFAAGIREAVTEFLKDRRESIRPGQICKDAAAKNIIPGDVAARMDALILRWGGNVTPQDPQVVKDDAERLAAAGEKLLPVLKAYTKERPS